MKAHDSLDAALQAIGDDNAVGTALTDIPVWVVRGQVYCAGKKGVEVRDLERLVWVYVEKYRSRFRFQRGYQLVMWDRDGSATVLQLKKRFLDATLNRIREASPWMPVGYNEAMKESWNADHADFIALVDTHRAGGKRFEADWAGTEIALVRLKTERYE